MEIGNVQIRVAVVVNSDHLYLCVGGDFESGSPAFTKCGVPVNGVFFSQKVNGDGRWYCTMFVFSPRRILDQMGGDLSKYLGLIFIIGVEFQSNPFSNTDDITTFAGKKCG